MKKITLAVLLIFAASLGQHLFSQSNSLAFDGTDDYVEVADDASLDFGTGDFTVEAWVRKESASVNYSNHSVVYKWDWSAASQSEWGLGLSIGGNNNMPGLGIAVGNSIYFVGSNEVFPLNTWIHLAGVRHGTDLKIYMNGVLKNTATIPANSAVNNIGQNLKMATLDGIAPNGMQVFTHGKFDEVRIWNVARSTAEIAANMNTELAGSEPGLVAYYKMNSLGAGGTVTDDSGNGRTGTRFGTAGANNLPQLSTSIPLQSPPPIEWQNTIGGNSHDIFYAAQQTSEGGYILGGSSNSPISGDKTENLQGAYDYWVVKLNAAGNIVWQNTIGGSGSDELTAIQQTADGGYILGGYSDSPVSGDKTEASLGNRDIWIIKLNILGNIVWQNTIGGDGNEEIGGIQQTADGGYILGAYSSSGISGDKTEANQGSFDYWLVKLDAAGSIVWQNTIGGGGADYLSALRQTSDGGYIVGGTSNSDAGGDKTENSNGDYDFWSMKLDASGNIVWQNTIGGSGYDGLPRGSIWQIADGGFILGGPSNSGISGDKTEASQGDFDFWVFKLDASGNIVWQNTIGGSGFDDLRSIQPTADGGFTVGGDSNSNISGDKTENSQGDKDFWILKLNASGNIVWQNTIGGSQTERCDFAQQTTDGGFALAGWSDSNISGDKTENSQGFKDFWMVKLAGNAKTLDFDGSDDYVEIGNDPLLQFGAGNFTVECWVKKESTSVGDANTGAVMKWANTLNPGQNEWALTLTYLNNNDIPAFFVEQGNTSYIVSGVNNLVLNTWTHIAGVRESTNLKIYVNGILKNTQAIPPGLVVNNVGRTVKLGYHNNQSANAQFDEVRIWNTARTAAQILSKMSCELAGTEANLVAYYDFNQGIAAGNNAGLTNLEDRTANQLDGTLTNFALAGTNSNWVAPGPALGCPITDIDGDGYSAAQGDCNDLEATVHPGATELCDMFDNDCDGIWNEGLTLNTVKIVGTTTTATCVNGTNGAINATVTLGTPPYVFRWFGPNGFTATTEDISGIMPGTYNLVVDDAAAGCPKAKKFIVKGATAKIAATAAKCKGSTGKLVLTLVKATGQTATVTWNNPTMTTGNILIATAGTYTATIVLTGPGGCTFQISGKISEPNQLIISGVDVTGAGPYLATVSTSGGTQPMVEFKAKKTNAPAGATITQASAMFPNLPTGIYRFDAKDANGCKAFQTGVPVPGGLRPADKMGERDENLTILEKAETPFFEKMEVQNESFQLAPNPARDAVQLIFSKKIESIGRVEIQNLDGKTLRSTSLENLLAGGGWMSLENLPSGVFVVSLRLDDGLTITRKLVVER